MSNPKPTADNASKPLGVHEFSRLLNDLAPGNKPYKPSALAVAVSGGADSMALTLVAAHWAARRKIPFYALTVDHGLRPDSGREAKEVGVILKKAGISHKVLKWQGDKPTTNIQAVARDARYELMMNWCRKKKIPDLMLAHHLDDQAETVLMRLIRGSGVDGLAAMSAVRETEGVRLVRPLLSVPSSRLKATCHSLRQAWFEDPGNQNIAYDRIKIRTLMTEFASLGLNAERLAQTARHMSRARQTLDQQTDYLISEIVTLNGFGMAELDQHRFRAAPEELALRLLSRCLMAVGGGTYAPRFERLMRLGESLINGSDQNRHTLAGCQIVCSDDKITMFREMRNLTEMPIEPGKDLFWDRRFNIRLSVSKPGGKAVQKNLRIAPLGIRGWKTVCDQKDSKTIKSAIAHVPLSARYTFPALWRENTLLAQPWLGFGVKKSGFDMSVTFSPQNWPKLDSFQVVSPAKDIIY
jgi:tRNA(Ile)-lysidine synthase